MRVAYDHQIFCLQEYGGVSRYFCELANRISHFPVCKVGIISPLYINAHLSGAIDCVQVWGQKIPAITGASHSCRAFNRVVSPFWMRKYHPDLVHETYYASRTYAPAGSKVVVTVHDMIHERFPELFSDSKHVSRNKAISVERANHVICVSEQTRLDLIDLFSVDPKKITVIHHGVALPKQIEKPILKYGRPYLLYVGSRTNYKNFDSLLQAYVAIPGLMDSHDIVVFGGGALKQQELKLIAGLGIRLENVHQIGGGDSVLAGLYRQADLFVYPSLYEGFGMPPLEAMSYGCPVVCSNVSSIPEIVGNAAEQFDPNSIDDLVQSIERVLNDANHRQNLVMRGKERLHKFSWERCAQQTMDVYKKVLS